LFLLGSVEERHAIEVKDVSVVIGELQAENLAAGTGISREDFKNSAKPEWVPVPDADQQATAAPHLQAASGTVSTTVEAGSVEPPVEAKKKDLPSIESIAEPVSDSIENTASATAANSPLVPEPVDFSDPAPEDDLEFHAEGNVDFVSEDSLDSLLEGDFDSLSEDTPEPVSVDEQESEYKSSQAPAAGAMAVASDDFVPAAGGQAVAPVPRRRLLLMTFLMVIAIALVLLLKACFVPQDGWSFLERAPVVPDEPVPAVIASAAKAVPAKATPAKVAPVKKQELMPMVVDAGLRLLIPAATADDSLAIEPLPAADDSDGETAESPGRSLDESDAEHAVEEVVLQSWQETISIPFTFDSDELAPDSRAVLDRAAAILLENKSSKASITGFTDSQGDSKYNLLLSRKRADAVERYLVDAGIARKRLHVEGGGMLGDPAESLESELEDPMGPYRIVEIKLVGEG
jgi:outer membrane protein OmpA-like peptidoglycan-associated protein